MHGLAVMQEQSHGEKWWQFALKGAEEPACLLFSIIYSMFWLKMFG